MIVVTGATGLLGSAIVRKLTESGEQVAALRQASSNISMLHDLNGTLQWRESNLLDPVSLMEALQGADTVVHAAAIVSFNPRMREQIHQTNVIGTRHLVDACLLCNVKKLIHISSVAALGRSRGMTHVSEESKWTSSAGSSDYAESKHLAELEVFRGLEEGLIVSIVNPSVVLGLGDWNRSSSKMFSYAWKQNPFYTDSLVNYVDARDVAGMVMKLIRQDFNGQRFIANAGTVSLFDLLKGIARRFHKKPPRIKAGSAVTTLVAIAESLRSFITRQEPLVTHQTIRSARETFYFDNSKTVRELQTKFTSLEETLDWCCAYYAQKNTINK